MNKRCAFIMKNGMQCKKKAVFGEYCTHHYLKTSKLAHIGTLHKEKGWLE